MQGQMYLYFHVFVNAWFNVVCVLFSVYFINPAPNTTSQDSQVNRESGQRM